jgi:hypothetical protein
MYHLPSNRAGLARPTPLRASGKRSPRRARLRAKWATRRRLTDLLAARAPPPERSGWPTRRRWFGASGYVAKPVELQRHQLRAGQLLVGQKPVKALLRFRRLTVRGHAASPRRVALRTNSEYLAWRTIAKIPNRGHITIVASLDQGNRGARRFNLPHVGVVTLRPTSEPIPLSLFSPIQVPVSPPRPHAWRFPAAWIPS